MIWTCDCTGQFHYVGPEWSKFTGQEELAARGEGWLKVLHPEDGPAALRMLKRACMDTACFTMTYRLKRADDTYARVVLGAAPSFSPVNGIFLGFLGSVTEILETDAALFGGQASGALALPPPAQSTMPLTMLDLLADQILLARSTADRLGETALFAALDLALTMVFLRFNTSTKLQ